MLIPALWLIVGVLSSTAWNLSLRRIMKGEEDGAAASVVSNAAAPFAILPFILFLGSGFSFEGYVGMAGIPLDGWAACIAAAALSVVFTYFSFKASKVVEAGERAVVSRLNIFWALLFAALFLGESISMQKIVAVAIIFIASGLSVYRKGMTKWKMDGLQLIVIASAFSAATGIAGKFGVAYMPPLVFAFFASAFLVIGLCAMLGRGVVSRCAGIWKRKTLDLAVNGVAGAVFYAASFVAYTMLPASIVIPIMATAVVLTAIAGGILLGEKEGWVQKIAGAVLALIGAYLIAGA